MTPGKALGGPVLCGLLCVCLLRSSAAAEPNARWMGSIGGETRLSELSIPGTHDSGARHEWFCGTTKCQTLTIPRQLRTGARFLDIRCRHVKNRFLIYHGPVYQRLAFDDVLTACYGFLGENPTECILMSVQEESKPSANTRAFEHTFDAYLAGNPARWRLAEGVPTLSQAQGKIVLLRRFKARAVPKGIDGTGWLDNASFTISRPAAKLRVQDVYRFHDYRWKWKAIQGLYEEAECLDRDCLCIDFTSGFTRSWFFGIPRIRAVSNRINPLLTACFAGETPPRRGITVMDFADDRRCSLIIAANRR